MFTGTAGRTQLIGPVLCTVLMIGCAGKDSSTDERRTQQQPEVSKPEPPVLATVSISGCVEAAPGPRQYVLRHVRFEPRETGDPHIDTTTAGAHGITEGAWVRLRVGKEDLGPHAGRRVTILGAITDNGQNTVGTAGTHGAQMPSGDASQAATSKHHSEKVKTEVAVQKIQTSGDKCPLEVQPDSR
jgi:hypothetical protein